MTFGKSKRGTKGRRYPKFVPTEEQRALVEACAAMHMNQDKIRLLVLNPANNKPVCKEILNRAFKRELQVGSTKLKELIASAYITALRNGESWAVRLSLKNKFCWSIGDNGTLPAEMLEDNSTPEMQITFVVPKKDEQLVDITPPTPSPYEGQAPHLSRPAL